MAESDTAMNTSASSATTSPKKAKAKAKKPRADPNRPKTGEMVTSAITNLKERGGSSLQAIKKHIAGHYKVDVEKLAPFIKKYLKTAVANGTLVQTKGKGASGSFKLGATGKEKKPKPATNAVKAKTVAKPKKIIRVAEKKVAKPKKAAEKKKPAAKPTKKAVEKKTPVKARKVKTPKKEKKAKAPKKPKSPKPKKAAKKSIKK